MKSENDFFKNAKGYKFEITRGTVDKLWYFRIAYENGIWDAWLGGYQTQPMAITKAIAKCRRTR